MNLLPKDHIEFGKEKFWDEFFAKIRAKPFEWYGEYDSLCEILDKYIRPNENVLVVGCGNSKLSADLYNVGFCNITNIDISATVIKQMKVRYEKQCPKMTFEKMDMFQMTFDDQSFSVVFDKGTLDAIMVDNLEETNEKVNKMFSEINRVLKYGGRYICVSLLQDHILRKVLDWFINEGWMVRVHRCFEAEKSHEHSSVTFPVFVLVLTKMKKMAGSLTILELAIYDEKAKKRVDSVKDVTDAIKSIQDMAFLKYYLSKKKLAVDEDDVCLELCCPKTGTVKYQLYVVDTENPASLKYAIFIVPQGRETEWLFATSKGRQDLAINADCERLVVVHLIRNFEYKNLDEVKKDLSEHVMELAPSSLKSQVPFLSLGEDVGCREVRHTGESEISGSFVVEDTVGENEQIYRRLIFLSNPYLIQSEAKLITVQPKNRKKRIMNKNLKIDFDYIACNHHAAMISGIALLNSDMTSPKILQVGLGGGSLVMYLYRHFRNAKIDVVELDPVIVAVAKEWFGLVTGNNRLVAHTADGITFIQDAAEKGSHYDVIMLDVDSKTPGCGLSCPPLEFVDKSIINLMSQLVSPDGVAIINLVCRNELIRNNVISTLKESFESVLRKNIPNEVNEVLYCLNRSKSENSDVKSQAIKLSSHIKKQSNSKNHLDVTEIMSCLETIR